MTRRNRILLAVIALTAVLAVTTVIIVVSRGGGGTTRGHVTENTSAPAAVPSTPPVTPEGGNITKLLTLPGDQVVTVADGTYSAGAVAAAHPETSGPYKGWLVLVAQSRHHVVVDMSAGPLTLDVGSSRVLFVGFKFINGTVNVRGDDIAFWYTEHTFPIETWNDQFKAAGGNSNALKTMINGVPKGIWIGDQTNGKILQRTQILGADVHDVGDDGIYVDKSQNGLVQGVRIWNIEKKNYDPGYNPWNPSIKELIHNDGLQIIGAVYNFTLADSYVGQTITVGGDNAPSKNLTWKDLWVARADGAGMIFYSANGYQVTGSMQDVRAWSNGFTQDPYRPDFDQLRVDIAGGRQAIWPQSLGSQAVDISSEGTNLNQQAPAGVSMDGPRMHDQSEALDSPDNPANVWRRAHPYTSWPSFFHFLVR